MDWGTELSYIRGLVTIWDGQGDKFFFAGLFSHILKLAVKISSQLPLSLPLPQKMDRELVSGLKRWPW